MFSYLEYIHKKTFSGLTELMSLDLSSNVITKINANLFKDLVGLKDLYLSNNPLLTIESGAMDGLWSLDTLSLGELYKRQCMGLGERLAVEQAGSFAA